jgi:DNA-binding CsgD family transcriptional regulator
MCAARRPWLDPLDLIEAAYAWRDSDAAWLKGIADAARRLSTASGASARLVEAREARPKILAAAFDGVPEHAWGEATSEDVPALPATLARALYSPGVPVAFARDRARPLPARDQAFLANTFESWGWEDALGILARDLGGRVLHVGIPMARRTRLHSRTLHRLGCVAAHLTSALRLRLAERPASGAPSSDAVLEPSGAVRHAAGSARDASVRARLTRAVRERERALGPLRRTDPDAALGLWRGLVGGTWSLLDHWDTDGRRFVLARRNAPHVADPKALTPPERAVVAFLAAGHPEKYVAYLLGLSPSTVATHFASARRKLRVTSRAGLVALLAPRAAPRHPRRNDT